MENRMTIGFDAKINPIKPLNNEMTLCRCYIMATGKNRNLSNISKGVVNNALPTLFNIPVVGHMYTDSEGQYHMGGHDMALVKDDKGNYVFKMLTVPYGVVPIQNNIHYEDVVDKAGNTTTYLVGDVILWTGRYPELKDAIYSEETYFGQSMEIQVISVAPLGKTEEDKKYMNIKEFTFSALCLLGKSDNEEENREPCFPEAKVEPYQFTLSDECIALMAEFKKELALCYEANTSEEGGEKRMTNEIRDLVLSEAGLVLDDLDFEVTNEMTEDEFRCKVDEIKKKKSTCQTHSADTNTEENNEDGSSVATSYADETTTPNQSENFSLTYREKFDEIFEQIKGLAVKGEDGCSVIEYWLQDFDDKYAYVSVEDYRDNGYKRSYGRISYVTSEDGHAAIVGTEIETMVCKWLTIDECGKIEEQRDEYCLLRDYKAQRLEDDRKKAYELVLSEFADLSANEEYQDLITKAMDFESSKALRKECFAIRGKLFVIPTKPISTEVTIPVEAKKNEDIPYGGFFTRYLPNTKK